MEVKHLIWVWELPQSRRYEVQIDDPQDASTKWGCQAFELNSSSYGSISASRFKLLKKFWGKAILTAVYLKTEHLPKPLTKHHLKCGMVRNQRWTTWEWLAVMHTYIFPKMRGQSLIQIHVCKCIIWPSNFLKTLHEIEIDHNFTLPGQGQESNSL